MRKIQTSRGVIRARLNPDSLPVDAPGTGLCQGAKTEVVVMFTSERLKVRIPLEKFTL